MINADVMAQREALAVTSNACLPHLTDDRGAIPVIILDWSGVDDLGFPVARCLVQEPSDPRGYTERAISIACLNRGL
jgi:hypothetical protein